MSHRVGRVAEVVREELAKLLLREVRDPRARRATVATVELTADLKVARVLVSVLGEESERVESVAALQGAAGFLRGRLGKQLRLRTSPELRFELDRGPEHSQRISDLLENVIHDDDESS